MTAGTPIRKVSDRAGAAAIQAIANAAVIARPTVLPISILFPFFIAQISRGAQPLGQEVDERLNFSRQRPYPRHQSPEHAIGGDTVGEDRFEIAARNETRRGAEIQQPPDAQSRADRVVDDRPIVGDEIAPDVDREFLLPVREPPPVGRALPLRNKAVVIDERVRLRRSAIALEVGARSVDEKPCATELARLDARRALDAGRRRALDRHVEPGAKNIGGFAPIRDMDRERGISPHEFEDPRQHEPLTRARRHVDFERSAQLVGYLAHGFLRVLEIGNDLSRPLEIGGSGFGQVKAVRRAIDKLCADYVLEPIDLLADRRGRAIQRAGSGGEAFLFDDLDEGE